MLQLDDVDRLLRDKAHWDQVGDPLSQMYYPHQDTVRRLRGSAIGAMVMSDDEALWVDRALCHVRRDSEERFMIMRRHYSDNRSLRWMHENNIGNRKRLAHELQAGREFVRGFLMRHIEE